MHYITCPNEARSKNALLQNSVILAIIIIIGYMGQTQNAITVMLSLAGLSLLHAFWDGMVRNNAKTQSI